MSVTDGVGDIVSDGVCVCVMLGDWLCVSEGVCVALGVPEPLRVPVTELDPLCVGVSEIVCV